MHGYNLQMALGPDVRVDTLAIVRFFWVGC